MCTLLYKNDGRRPVTRVHARTPFMCDVLGVTYERDVSVTLVCLECRGGGGALLVDH